MTGVTFSEWNFGSTGAITWSISPSVFVEAGYEGHQLPGTAIASGTESNPTAVLTFHDPTSSYFIEDVSFSLPNVYLPAGRYWLTLHSSNVYAAWGLTNSNGTSYSTVWSNDYGQTYQQLPGWQQAFLLTSAVPLPSAGLSVLSLLGALVGFRAIRGKLGSPADS